MSADAPEGTFGGTRDFEGLCLAIADIHREHALERVLQQVVDSARDVIGARYAALGVLDETGTKLARFVTSGVSEELKEKIGPLPEGKGILGLLINERKPLRLTDLSSHPAAHGFPKHHPAMTSFLGVPVSGRDEPIGNLYLTEKLGAPAFSEADEAIAMMLASQAAVACENAQLHEKSAELLGELREAQVSRDRFYAMINHELRNALTAVFGWSDLLLRKMGDDAPRAAVEVYESAERTLSLVNDLLDMSRLDADRLVPAIRDADAWEMVHEAVRTVEPAATKREVGVEIVGPKRQIPCRTDPQHVRQILINLLTNAVRHSPDGKRVTVAIAPADSKLVISVKDQGSGIAAELLGAIFEAFTRGASADERGTGLGLTLSRRLARRLGGDLTVESEVQQGATFTLELPLNGSES